MNYLLCCSARHLATGDIVDSQSTAKKPGRGPLSVQAVPFSILYLPRLLLCALLLVLGGAVLGYAGRLGQLGWET